MKPSKLDRAIAVHREAVTRFTAAATATPHAEWQTPRSDGKWSPAQVTEHLVLTYEVILGELAGGPAMRLRAKWWQRIVIRLMYLRRALDQAILPEGVRAPREVRPSEHPEDQGPLIARFEARAAEFEREIVATRKRLTHAYFGRLGNLDGLKFCRTHILHHLKQMENGEVGERE